MTDCIICDHYFSNHESYLCIVANCNCPGYLGSLEDLDVLAELCHNNASRKGFWDEDRPFAEVLTNMHSEISEAWEEYVLNKDITEVYYEGKKPCGIPIELADLLIRTLSLMAAYKMDVGSLVLEKMKYNLTRPYKHGKKA